MARVVGDAEAESQMDGSWALVVALVGATGLEVVLEGVAGCGVRDGEREEWLRDEGELAEGERTSSLAEGDER